MTPARTGANCPRSPKPERNIDIVLPICDAGAVRSGLKSMAASSFLLLRLVIWLQYFDQRLELLLGFFRHAGHAKLEGADHTTARKENLDEGRCSLGSLCLDFLLGPSPRKLLGLLLRIPHEIAEHRLVGYERCKP